MENTSNLKKWEKYVKQRLSHLLISRRFDISARGTCFLALYSEKPIVGVDMWSIKGFTDDDSKITALWFNSTINLLALFINRTETRGAWTKLHEYAMRDMKMLDPKKLSENEREQMLRFFENFKNLSFPSILDQFKTKFYARKELDVMILQLVGYTKEETEELLTYLYPAIAKEIEKLKVLMEG